MNASFLSLVRLVVSKTLDIAERVSDDDVTRIFRTPSLVPVLKRSWRKDFKTPFEMVGKASCNVYFIDLKDVLDDMYYCLSFILNLT